MKPSLFLFTDSLEPSGVGVHMLTLAAELRDRYDISFVCPPAPAALSFLERAAAMGLDTLAIDLNGDPDARDELCQWLQAARVSIFHCHAGIGWEGHSGVYAARDAGVPVVVRTEHLPYLITKPHEQQEHLAAAMMVDRVICVSQEAASTFREAGVPAHKISVVLNGIPLSPNPIRPGRLAVRESLGLPPTARIILTVGRMTPQKGHRYLAAAAPAVIVGEPNAFFAWLGTGPLEAELRDLVARLGVAERVLFLGARSNALDLMAASDLLAVPSLFEGLPLTVLEAMAAGLPIVGTRVCGTSEAVFDGLTGRLVEPADPQALAEAILEALHNPGLTARWTAAAQLEVQRKFSAARMAAETAAIYEELVSTTTAANLHTAGYHTQPTYQNLNL